MNDVVVRRAEPGSAELPIYEGIPLSRISLVVSDELAGQALAVLMAADAIGFDSESKPTFLKGEVSTGPHLVQLATESAAVLKVGLGLGNDRSALKSVLGIEARQLLDLGEVLRGPGHRGTVGAKVAVAHFFGARLQKSKKTGTSNWANPHLSERQLLYAANDAHVALRLYRAWLSATGAAATGSM